MTPHDGAHPEAVPGWVAGTAVAGTVGIALGAFWLSFTSLADLARRSGISGSQAWAWPLIVDGIIVVATISVVALHEHGRAATRYPWSLLLAGAAVSVTANAVDAVVSAQASVPPVVAAAVSAVPPLVLLAITHLTVELTRRSRRGPAPLAADEDSPADRRQAARRLRAGGGSYRRIAAELGVHPSTVGRWLGRPSDPETDAPNVRGGGHPSRQDEVRSGAEADEPGALVHLTAREGAHA